MIPPLLDTHAWIWWVDGDARLDRRVARGLDSLPETDRPCLSAISLWEAATLVSLGRMVCKSGFDGWIATAAHPKTVRIMPITPEIAIEVARLPESLRRDPADRIIVATGRVHHWPIVTADRAILESKLLRQWKA